MEETKKADDSGSQPAAEQATKVNPIIPQIRDYFNMWYGESVGFMQVWTTDKKSYYYDMNDLESAASKCLELRDEQDVYFGLCLRKENLGPWKRGTASEVSVVPGLWLDIDCKEGIHKEKKLPAFKEASELIADAFELKPSIMNHTGGGYHTYWLFDKPLIINDEEEQKRIESLLSRFQQIFIRLADIRGWKVDNTSDLPRILRVPFTFNRKFEEPVLVRVMGKDKDRKYTLVQLETAIKQAEFALSQIRASSQSEVIAAAELLQPTRKEYESNGKKASARLIMNGCKFMQHCRDDADSLAEPKWHKMVNILGHAGMSNEEIHDLSRPYKGFSEKETDEKIKRALVASGPYTCEKIQKDHGDEWCKSCPHNGKVKSPITLGFDRVVPLGTQEVGALALLQDDPEWFVGKKFFHDRMAAFIRARYHIVKYPNADGDLHIYDEEKGYYVQDKKKNILKGIIRHHQIDLKVAQVNEVVHLLSDTSKVFTKLSTGVIAVKNGLLKVDFTTKKVIRTNFTPDLFVTYKIDVNYNPNAYDSHVASTFNKVTDGHIETIKNLEEMLGCVLYPQRLITRIFYLYGRSAHNGKSAILQLIYNTFGRENISAETPQRLADNSFAASSLIGKTANIVDDLPDKIIEDIGHLKSITTGVPIQTERKGEGSEPTLIDATLIFASNFFPNFRENGKQVDRRLWIMPFEHDFSTDPECLSDFEAEQRANTDAAKEYILKLAVDGLERLLHSTTPDRLTSNPRVDATTRDFKEHNDPLFDYFQDWEVTDFLDCKGLNVYKQYVDWCHENNVKYPFSTQRWKDAVMNHYHLEWKDIRWSTNGKPGKGKGFAKTDKTPLPQLVTGKQLETNALPGTLSI